MGTTAYRTLERFLNSFVRESLDVRKIAGNSPYFLTVKLKQHTIKDLYEQIVSFCDQGLTAEDLVSCEEAPRLQKFDEFIPNNLLRQAFACDYINMTELSQILRGWQFN
jgi:ATP-dependent Lhr-like helicase